MESADNGRSPQLSAPLCVQPLCRGNKPLWGEWRVGKKSFPSVFEFGGGTNVYQRLWEKQNVYGRGTD